MFGILLFLIRYLTSEPAHSTGVNAIPSPAPAVAAPLPHTINSDGTDPNKAPEFNRKLEESDEIPIPVDTNRTSLDTSDNAVPPTPGIFNRSGLNAAASILLSSWPRFTLIPTNYGVPEIDESKDPTDLSPVTAEMEEILTKWEAANPPMKTARIQFDRTTYNLVFEVEKIATGEILYEDSACFSIVVRAEHPNTKKGKRIGTSGNLFRIEADRAERWISTPKGLLTVNDAERSFALLNTDVSILLSIWIFGAQIDDAFRSMFLLDIDSATIRRQWELSGIQRKSDSIVIEAFPRTSALKSRWSKYLVMIDSKSWRTKAIKLIDESCHIETVYVIRERTVNEKLPENCFTPDLIGLGYKENWNSKKALNLSAPDARRYVYRVKIAPRSEKKPIDPTNPD